jgi:hypothetical protein
MADGEGIELSQPFTAINVFKTHKYANTTIREFGPSYGIRTRGLLRDREICWACYTNEGYGTPDWIRTSKPVMARGFKSLVYAVPPQEHGESRRDRTFDLVLKRHLLYR